MKRLKLLPPLLITITLLTLIFTACSDDPTSPPLPKPSPTQQVNGTTTMPAGYTGDQTTLKVINSLNTTNCTADGKFTSECFANDRQLVAICGPEDRPLLMAWFGKPSPVINTRTTAEVLLWQALGSWMLPPDGRSGLRIAIANLTTELNPLETALDAAIIANPAGLPESNPEVHQALQTLVTNLLTEAVVELNANYAPGLSTDKGAIISPPEMQSGVEVLNEGGINKVTIKNSYRRRSMAFIWKEAWTDTNGHTFPLNPDTAMYKFEILPVDGFAGSLNTILGCFFGSVAYTPKFTGPFHLPAHKGAVETHYEFDVLGFGLEPAENPSQYTTEELTAGDFIAIKGLLLDYFFPLLTNMAEAVGDDGPFDGLLGGSFTSEMSNYINFIAVNIPSFITCMSNNDWWGAVVTLLNSAVVNGEFQQETMNLLTASLVSSSMDADQVTDVLRITKSFMKAVKTVDIIGNLVDNIITGVHFGECERANTWDIDISAPVIHLEPREAEIETHNNQLITCVLDDDTGGPPTGASYAYLWSCAGETGLMINPAHPADTSNHFLSSYDYVQYQANRGIAGTERITCTVYYKVGPDTTRISDDTMTITVTKREIALQDTLAFCGEDEITLIPVLEPAYTGDEVVVWAWQSGGSAGQLTGPAGQTGSWSGESDPSATYYSDATGGSDQLMCIASRDINGVISPVDTAFVYVDVGPQTTYAGELKGTWYHNAVEGHCGHTVYIRFPKIGGATHYSVYGYNYTDFHMNYFGTSFTRSGPPWPPGSLETDSEVFVWMTAGGGNSGCEGDRPRESMEWSLSRFAGVIIEVTPNCE